MKKMKMIKVNLGDRSYDIATGYKLLGNLGSILNKLQIGSHAVIITNPSISHLYANSLISQLRRNDFIVKVELVTDSETSKSFSTSLKLINNLASYDGLNKKLFLIALGGGVIGDLAGFVAAIYKRGIPYIQIPTTLLAQVDSSIGGKVAIDLSCGKNLVGAFYQPRFVMSDLSYLHSLSIRQIRSGLGEIIKYAVIRDEKLFEYLEKEINKVASLNIDCLEKVIVRCSQIKAKIIEADELEKIGKRSILNFGHTVGHAIETACEYSKKVTHGEAVAIGISCACDISYKMGLVKKPQIRRVKALIEKAGLPIKIKRISVNNIMKALLHDKKFIHGKTRFVLLSKIGKVKIVEGIAEGLIRKTVKAHIA